MAPASRRACIAGVGETRYARWGGIADASEHALALEAILRAVDDAGLPIDAVDGLASFAGDRNDAVILAADLGLPELRHASMVWLPGGGGGCAAVANAALAVESGQGVSNLVDAEPSAVHVGMAVELEWEDVAPGLALPRFRPA